MVRVGRNLKDHLIPTFSTRPGCSELHPACLEPCQGGGSHSFSDNLCQCLTTLMVKNIFLISNLNLPSFSLQLFPPCPITTPLWKVPLHPSCRPFQVPKGCSKVTPEPSLLQAEQPQLPQPVLLGEVYDIGQPKRIFSSYYINKNQLSFIVCAEQ